MAVRLIYAYGLFIDKIKNNKKNNKKLGFIRYFIFAN